MATLNVVLFALLDFALRVCLNLIRDDILLKQSANRFKNPCQRLKNSLMRCFYLNLRWKITADLEHLINT